MSYSKIIAADQRRALLDALEQDLDYAHNEYVLQSALQMVGHGISADKLRTELRWLEEQGLVEIENSDDIWVIKLTRRGEDVALGNAKVEGVARRRL